MRKPIIAALCAAVLWAQNPNTAVYPNAVVTDTDLLTGENLAQSPLTSDITADATTIPVLNAGIFRVPTAVTIDAEIIKICAKNTAANTLIVCSGGRGFDRTTAVSHASGTMVRATIAAHYHNQLAAEIKAIESTLGPNLSNVRTTINAVGGASNLDTVGRVPFTSASGIVDKSTLHFSSSNQRLGIGVTASHERLDVLGRLKLRDDGNYTAGVFFNDTNGSGDVFVGKTTTAANGPLGVWHSGAWRLRIRSDGNVGINVGDPLARLHVSGSVRFDTNFSGQGTGFGGVTQTFTWPSPRGTNLYYGYRFDIQDSLLDGSAAIAVYNTGTADGIFIEARGHSTGSTSPTGLAIAMNKIGTDQNNPNYSGYGIQVWDYTSAANPGSPLLVRNTAGGTRRLAQFQNIGNGPAIIELLSGNTANQESIFRFQDRTGATQWDFGKSASNNLIFRTGGGTTVAEIRSDRLQAPLIDSGGTVINVKSRGAVGDGATNDSSAIQDAINAAQAVGGLVYFPPGTYLISSTLQITAGVALAGTGSQSVIKGSGTFANLVAVNTGDPVMFSNLSFEASGSATSGALISITGPASLGNVRSRVENCRFFGGWDHINVDAAVALKIVNNDFDFPQRYAIRLNHSYDTDKGGILVFGNHFTNLVQKGVQIDNVGGVRIEGNYFANGTTQVALSFTSSTGTWNLRISNNTFDNFSTRAIDLAQTGSGYYQHAVITGNTIVPTSGSNRTMINVSGFITGIIDSNSIACTESQTGEVGIGLSPTYGIWSISNNNIGSCDNGINVNASNELVHISNNRLYWLLNNPIISTANGRVTEANMTFSQLGAWANGSIVYCTNCTVAATCAAGGSGALAKRINNTWVCN